MNSRKAQLGDVADFITGFPFKSRDYSKDGSGIRLLRGDNIAQGFLRWENAKFWSEPVSEEFGKYALKQGDVVLAMDRPWIEAGLKYSVVLKSDLPALLVQRVTRLRSTEHIEAGYLRYLIGSQEFTKHVHTVSTGTAVPHISGRDILAFEFELPDFASQKNISAVLVALDNKIELNRRMSATLEEMARALYRSWFVDFDPVHARALGQSPAHMDPTTAALFPDSFGPNGLPKGWDETPLDAIADFLNGAALQKFPAQDGDDWLPVIKIAELRGGLTAKSNKAGLQVPDKYKVRNGDVLFSWSGSLLQKVWTDGPGALNQHLFKVTSGVVPKWFHFFAVDQHMDDFRQIAASKATTMGHIQRHHLKEALITMPNDHAVIDAADRIVGPLFDRAISADLECHQLAALRDTLLPRLMSGELRIREAEKQIEEVLG
jgi:type I restriction enzyme S subunit